MARIASRIAALEQRGSGSDATAASRMTEAAEFWAEWQFWLQPANMPVGYQAKAELIVERMRAASSEERAAALGDLLALAICARADHEHAQ